MAKGSDNRQKSQKVALQPLETGGDKRPREKAFRHRHLSYWHNRFRRELVQDDDNRPSTPAEGGGFAWFKTVELAAIGRPIGSNRLAGTRVSIDVPGSACTTATASPTASRASASPPDSESPVP